MHLVAILAQHIAEKKIAMTKNWLKSACADAFFGMNVRTHFVNNLINFRGLKTQHNNNLRFTIVCHFCPFNAVK